MKPLTSVNVQEISTTGPVTQDDNVKVSAILVEHPPVKPALAYRFDFKDRSIAFSGDTAPLEAVAKMAKGADVLVHETMYVPAVETYIRGPDCLGSAGEIRRLHGAYEGGPHTLRRCRSHRPGRGRQNAPAVAPLSGHRQHR